MIALRTTFGLMICLLALSVPLCTVDASEDLNHLIRQALTENRDLTTWQARVAAAAEMVPQAGVWPDPMVSFSIMNLPVDTFDPTEIPMTGNWVTVTQSIPLTDRFQLQEEIARARLAKIQTDKTWHELEIIRRVTSVWYNWRYQLSAEATLDSTRATIDDLLRVTYSRYETGKGRQRDILRLEAELSRLEVKRVALQQQALAAGRRLAVLIGADPDELPDPPSVSTPLFPALDLKQIETQLREQNPQLQKAAIEQEVNELKTGLARRGWWPDLKVSLGYGFRGDAPDGMNRSDLLTFMVGTTIPLHAGKKRSAIEESRLRQQQTSAAQLSLHQELRLQLALLVDRDERLAEQINLYREGVELQLAMAGKAALLSWTTTESGIEQLLADRRSLLQARLERLALERDRLLLRASLAALIAETGMETEGKIP
jgi:outer membrane protein, heavy metal efflux system